MMSPLAGRDRWKMVRGYTRRCGLQHIVTVLHNHTHIWLADPRGRRDTVSYLRPLRQHTHGCNGRGW